MQKLYALHCRVYNKFVLMGWFKTSHFSTTSKRMFIEHIFMSSSYQCSMDLVSLYRHTFMLIYSKYRINLLMPKWKDKWIINFNEKLWVKMKIWIFWSTLLNTSMKRSNLWEFSVIWVILYSIIHVQFISELSNYNKEKKRDFAMHI